MTSLIGTPEYMAPELAEHDMRPRRPTCTPPGSSCTDAGRPDPVRGRPSHGGAPPPGRTTPAAHDRRPTRPVGPDRVAAGQGPGVQARIGRAALAGWLPSWRRSPSCPHCPPCRTASQQAVTGRAPGPRRHPRPGRGHPAVGPADRDSGPQQGTGVVGNRTTAARSLGPRPWTAAGDGAGQRSCPCPRPWSSWPARPASC